MDILLDNPLTNIYGPYFLILYGFTTLFTILFFGFFRSRLDQSDRLPLPSIPTDIDPYEIAYLRGGVNEMARTAVFSLVRKGLIEIKKDGKRPMITRTTLSQWRGTATVEDAALNWFVVSREPKAVFAGGGLTEVLEPYADEYLRRLGRQQLIAGTEMQKRLSAWRRPAYAVILGLGGYKAFASIVHGYFNLLGILAIAIIGVIAIYYVGRLPWLTKLGKAYLDRLRTAFEKLRYLGEAEKPGMAGQQTPAAAGGPAFDPMLLSVVSLEAAYWSARPTVRMTIFSRSRVKRVRRQRAAAGDAEPAAAVRAHPGKAPRARPVEVPAVHQAAVPAAAAAAAVAEEAAADPKQVWTERQKNRSKAKASG